MVRHVACCIPQSWWKVVTMISFQRPRSIVAALAAVCLIVDPALRLASAAQGGTQTAARPAASPTAPSAASTPPIDGGWPRFHSLPSGGSILVYQPQIASWDRQKHLVAFAAV